LRNLKWELGCSRLFRSGCCVSERFIEHNCWR